MSYKAITKYSIFGDTSKNSLINSFENIEQNPQNSEDMSPKINLDLDLIKKDKKVTISEYITNISPKNNSTPEINLIYEEKITLSEYMSHKIEDPDIAIENLKKELERYLTNYT